MLFDLIISFYIRIKLKAGVEINAISSQGPKIDVTKIPEDDFPNNDFRVKVLFVPGHYDALYV